MSSLTAERATTLMTGWRNDMVTKSANLTKGARFYKVANFLVKICVAAFTVILLVIESIFLTDPSLSKGARLALYIIVLAFQVALAIFNAGDAVVKPANKSSDCSICAKQYNELVREMDVTMASIEIDSLDDIIDKRELHQKSMYYSTKEQLIHQLEPMLVWIGHNKQDAINIRAMSSMNDETLV